MNNFCKWHVLLTLNFEVLYFLKLCPLCQFTKYSNFHFFDKINLILYTSPEFFTTSITILNAKTFQGQRYGNVPFLQEVQADNQMYLIKTEIDEGAEGPEYEMFCDPTNQEDDGDALFEVKDEPNDDFEGAEGAKGPEYETFCDPTNQENGGDALLEVKDEPKDDFDSDEVWVVDIIKQDEG